MRIFERSSITASTYTTFFIAGSSSAIRWRNRSSAVSFLSGSFFASGGGGARYTPSQELNGSQSRGEVFQHSGWQSRRS